MGFKLNKIAKSGLAIGLAAIITLGASGCTSYTPYFNYNNNDYNYSQNYDQNNNSNNSYNYEQSDQTYTPQYSSDYINVLTSNEFKTYDESMTTTPITINNYNYMNFSNYIKSQPVSFRYADYYGLDEAIALYNTIKVNKQTSSTLLNESGKLDTQKLISQVQANNKAYWDKGKTASNFFYTELSGTDMTKICNIIAEVVNSRFNDVEINKVANTLMQLTMFQRKGTTSNAYITNNLTFIYNPTMTNIYADMLDIKGNKITQEEALKSVITHEVMHLLQYSSSDVNDENGIESGICRMYNVPNKEAKVTVDSLWNSWLLEAAAEMGMSDYLNIKPGTYAKKISYAKSYNLSRFNELNLETQTIEDVAFNHTLEEAYKDLELTTPEEQREFLNYLYSVEITQTDPVDFWENYTAKTGKTPTENEKLAIRMDIRTDAVKFLTRSFYNNLIDSLAEGKVTDLNTVFYLIRNWELDVFGHLEYTKTSAFDAAKDFVIWHDQIQNEFFSAIANSNNLSQEYIESSYADYNLQASINNQTYDNCNLNNYNSATKSYVLEAKEAYVTGHFSRNNLVAKYITENQKTVDNTAKTK